MVTLGTQDFTNLLHDIYTIYAPDKMDGIDVLIAKYDGDYVSQRNAIQMAYIIYNKPKHPQYNPESGTETNITKLMERYARGERIISQDVLNEEKELAAQAAAQAESQQSEETQRQLEERLQREEEERARREKEDQEKAQTLSNIKKQTEEQTKKLQELEELKKLIEKQKDFVKNESEKIKKNIVSSGDLFSDIQLECDLPIQFPGGNDYLITLCIGQRLIYQDPETGAIIGLEVEDINDDLFSSEDKRPIRIMKIKKV